MLRRKSPSAESGSPEPKGFVPLPASTEPFVLGHALSGIHFYLPKEAFYCSYTTLQSMRLCGDSLTLIFAADQVLIEGRCLHSLYVEIAEHKVRRVHEQGERYEAVAGEGVYIRRIERRGRVDS